MNATRRDILRGSAGALAGGALAGCLGSVGLGSSEGNDGYAAFFTLADFSRQVAGGEFDIENPVPAGAMGHLWDEPQGLREDVLITDAFVYLGVEGYQGWALDTARTAEAEGSDIVLIDALEGVDLLGYGGNERADEGDGHGHEEDGDHDEESDSHEDEEDHEDHGHGDYDPHFWLDPLRARNSVGTIAGGLSEADPDDETTYEENAEAYGERLQELHERFENELESRDHDVAVVAGHDSYQYLADRYDFEIRSPVGVQPDAEPSEVEIADTVELIDGEGIDAILYNYFESPDGNPPRAANVIVEESDASEAVAVSPVEGTTEEWNEKGYGYVEQMEEINLPAFKRALGAE